MASDSFIGEGLAPSPYREAMAEVERLRGALIAVRHEIHQTSGLRPEYQDWDEALSVIAAALGERHD